MLKTIMPKVISLQSNFLDFGEAEIMVVGDFGRSELRFFVILLVRGPILRILWIFVFPGPKKELPGTKKDSQNEVILYPKSSFFESCVFYCFFECSVFFSIFEILGTQRLHFGTHFD